MSDLHQVAFDAYRAGDFAGAEAAYRRLLEQNPADVDARMTLGVVLRRLGRLGEAISLLDDVVAAAPNDFRAFANLGLALQTAKRLDDAIAAYRRAYRLEPRTIRQIAVNLSALGTGTLFLDPRKLEGFLAQD